MHDDHLAMRFERRARRFFRSRGTGIGFGNRAVLFRHHLTLGLFRLKDALAQEFVLLRDEPVLFGKGLYARRLGRGGFFLGAGPRFERLRLALQEGAALRFGGRDRMVDVECLAIMNKRPAERLCWRRRR
jgi:hypothetical protein